MANDPEWKPNPAWVTAEYRLLYYNPMSGFKVVHKDSEEWKQFEASQIPDKGFDTFTMAKAIQFRFIPITNSSIFRFFLTY